MLFESANMARDESVSLFELCFTLLSDSSKAGGFPKTPEAVMESPACKVLRAAFYAGKYGVFNESSTQRVFVQEFAASLNRKGMLKNPSVDQFTRLGYEYMGV